MHRLCCVLLLVFFGWIIMRSSIVLDAGFVHIICFFRCCCSVLCIHRFCCFFLFTDFRHSLHVISFFTPAFFSVNAHRKNAIKYTPDGFGTYGFFFHSDSFFVSNYRVSRRSTREIQTTVQCAWTLIKVCVRIFWQKHIFFSHLWPQISSSSHECEPQHCSVHSSNNSTPVMIFSRRFV